MLISPAKIVCNFTNALFFWAIQPETAKRPLEEMNYLFTNAPIFVPTMVSLHQVILYSSSYDAYEGIGDTC